MNTSMFLLLVLLLFAPVLAFADPPTDPAVDHRTAIRRANEQFIVAFDKCERVPHEVRAKCRGIAKAKHTRAVEQADREARQ